MINLFNNYTKKFDLSIKPLMGKYHHSFRVTEFAREIAISLDLSDDDVYLASVCGLLHDIGRFRQYTEYNTYIDRNSFDHGDVGYEILSDLLSDYKDKDIILMATKYHNKANLPKLDDRTLLFCKIVRDADKLDIMIEQCNSMNDKEVILKKEILDDIYNNRVCRNNLVNNDTDYILRELSWVNDIYYQYTIDYLINKNIIENKFNLLSLYGETKEIKEFKDYIYKQLNRRDYYGRKG